MATNGESSSAPPKRADDKPVIVRVKRKATQAPLDALWLEINERPLKRQLLDFEKLTISDSSGKEELKARKVLVQHVETVTTTETTIDSLQSFLPTFSDALDGRTKSEERKRVFKKDNIHDQNLSKARQQQEVLAKNARFEQIWRSRKGNKEEMHGKELCEMCHFYDVVRVDVEDRSNELQRQEDLSLEDQRLLSRYLPILKEFLPSAAADIESDMQAYLSKQDEYVYDYYTLNDDMIVDEDASNPFPLVQVEDEEFYDGPDESEDDSEDSNAEDNPRNEYPDEISDVEEEEEEAEEDRVERQASDKSEDESERGYIDSRVVERFLDDDFCYGDFDNDNILCNDDDEEEEEEEEDEEDGETEDWRWSYR